jgi:SpoIID/LytB domain protein
MDETDVTVGWGRRTAWRGRRRLALTVALACAGVLATTLPAGSADAAARRAVVPLGDLTVIGSGFGHGVGMSQYGALGMARGGASGSEILRHYFSGTSVVGYSDDIDLRVNVVDRGSDVTLRSVSLGQGGGLLQLTPDAGSPVTVAAGGSAVVTPTDTGLSVAVTGGGTSSTLTAGTLAVHWSGGRSMGGPAGLLQVDSHSANAASTSSKSRQYRWGSLTRPRIEGVAIVNLHTEYLRGIAEVPSSWPAAALQAQVVAARNYALAQSHSTSSTCGGCNLYDDTRSQVYRGWEKESAVGGDRWVAAVAATQTSTSRGLAVLYNGSPVTAYYSSSTGGRTRDAAAVWGRAVPYLVSVDDKWSLDPSVNPMASWTRTVPMAKVVSAFGLTDVVQLTVTDRDNGGAVSYLQAKSSDGTMKTISGNVLRGSFGLPAQWVKAIAIPAAAPPAPPGS